MRYLISFGLILFTVSQLARADPGLATPAPAGQAVQQAGPQVIKEARFSSWGLSCALAQNERGTPVERCMISQLVAIDPKGEKTLLGITVDYLDSPILPTMHARFSSGATMKAGIGIKIDDRPDLRLAISDCDARRCESVGRLSPAVLKAWRTGRHAQFAFIEQGGKQVLLPVSLAGFDSALSALARHNAQAARAKGK